MKVTISDVARLAGVSTATVSHTINSTRYVSGETKEKVYRAIAELGYTPDASARSFRTGKKKTIGFIVPDISNKFFATMIESVENYLSAHGYHLIIANTKENPEREETNIRLLSAGLVDGLLIASTMEDFSRFESLIPAGFPVVLVDRTFDTKRFPSVSVSNFQPIYRSVCRLAGKGDKRIGMIGGLPRLSSTKERIAAYQEAVADCGLPQDDLLIRYGNSMENSAQSCLDELLEQKCGGPGPDGLGDGDLPPQEGPQAGRGHRSGHLRGLRFGYQLSVFKADGLHHPAGGKAGRDCRRTDPPADRDAGCPCL